VDAAVANAREAPRLIDRANADREYTMTVDTDTALAEIMRAADPNPGMVREPLTMAQLALRDQILSERAKPRASVGRGMADSALRASGSLRRWTAPVTAVGATAAVVAIAALSMSALPAPLTGTSASVIATPPPLESDDGVAEAWALAHERATSAFEIDVLSDGQVTLEEYREAQRRFIDCIADAGLTVRITGSLDSGTQQYEVSSSRGDEATNTVVSDCETGTIDVIEGLYLAIIGYAEKLDAND
jgi:hypothetical protein